MNNSLRDQMLKTGLISKKQAKKSEKQTKLKARQQRKNNTTDENSISSVVSQKRDEEIAHAKELNRLKEEQRFKKELQSQIHDIIQRHRVNESNADIVYNFVESDKLVKQILVTNKQQQQLTNGHLAIAFVDDGYHLIPAPIAEKLLERTPEIIVCYNVNSTTNEDDPYADYKVPDDLMW
ncbi:DUF2058 domain-containing protein [Thiotrichales bacterium HSG1]|nr:DUF2058 domain-containing protein [Thiotrichales bacterium HSG1]